MAAPQPLNTAIAVNFRVRAYRQDLRHEAVRALTSNGFRGLVVSVPGEERLVGQTRDSTAGVIATSLIHGRGTGLPVTRIPEAFMTVAGALTATDFDYDLTGPGKNTNTLDYPVRLPGCRDFQLQKKAANITDDLFAQLKTGHADNP